MHVRRKGLWEKANPSSISVIYFFGRSTNKSWTSLYSPKRGVPPCAAASCDCTLRMVSSGAEQRPATGGVPWLGAKLGAPGQSRTKQLHPVGLGLFFQAGHTQTADHPQLWETQIC